MGSISQQASIFFFPKHVNSLIYQTSRFTSLVSLLLTWPLCLTCPRPASRCSTPCLKRFSYRDSNVCTHPRCDSANHLFHLPAVPSFQRQCLQESVVRRYGTDKCRGEREANDTIDCDRCYNSPARQRPLATILHTGSFRPALCILVPHITREM